MIITFHWDPDHFRGRRTQTLGCDQVERFALSLLGFLREFRSLGCQWSGRFLGLRKSNKAPGQIPTCLRLPYSFGIGFPLSFLLRRKRFLRSSRLKGPVPSVSASAAWRASATTASITEPTWPSEPPGEIYPSKADSTIVATKPKMTWTRLGLRL